MPEPLTKGPRASRDQAAEVPQVSERNGSNVLTDLLESWKPSDDSLPDVEDNPPGQPTTSDREARNR